MCMFLKGDRDIHGYHTSFRSALKKPKGPVTVYKFYQLKSPIGRALANDGSELKVVAAFRREFKFVLKKNCFVKSNRSDRRLSSHERSMSHISLGLHSYCDVDAATLSAENKTGYHNKYVVVEMRGYPRDFVARGEQSGRKQEVWMKLRFVRVHSVIKMVRGRMDSWGDRQRNITSIMAKGIKNK